MRNGTLTREEVIAIFGEEIINELESANCEPTSRCQTDGDEDTEWSASVNTPDHDEYYGVTAYYYTSPKEDEIMAEHDGDGSFINWEIEGYEVY